MTAHDPLEALRGRGPFRLAGHPNAAWVLDKHGAQVARVKDGEDCAQGLSITAALNLALASDAKLRERDEQIAALKAQNDEHSAWFQTLEDCSKCGGAGWYEGVSRECAEDPDGNPVQTLCQVQCGACLGTGKSLNRTAPALEQEITVLQARLRALVEAARPWTLSQPDLDFWRNLKDDFQVKTPVHRYGVYPTVGDYRTLAQAVRRAE